MYDYYASHGIESVVVDADEYMTSEDFVRKLASRLGLDPQKVITRWTKSSEKEKGEMHHMLLSIQRTLVESEGLKPERASKNVNLRMEREKWKTEFEEPDWRLIEELVDMAMPHYEYLRERRFRG